MQKPVLQPAEILVPNSKANLALWAVLACDQYTSEPDYWAQVGEIVGDAPSTLHMIFPEVYLEKPGAEQRIQAVHSAMAGYASGSLFSAVNGYVYVERTLASGAVRQGLVGCVDLEDYSYRPGAAARVRPSESTVVERIPPRLAVRRGAALETPHILMLADDPEQTIIEPVAAKKQSLQPLYSQTLMLGGGTVSGWAVTSPEDIRQIGEQLQKLDDEQRFFSMYGATAQTASPFALAVGDGNHSLATAKAYWEELSQTLSPEKKQHHPARFCLVELENIQSPAIQIEPIHRVVFGASSVSFLHHMALFAQQCGAQILPEGEGQQQFIAVSSAGRHSFGLINPPAPLAVGTVDAFLQSFLETSPDIRVDYVHGEDSVNHLAYQGAIGVLLPPFQKSDIFKGVALGGVLPRKTFSMGHAAEKRYYLECRKIVK